MRIYFFSPFDSARNYGAECNHYCSLINDPDAWICISDQDVMFFTTTEIPQARHIEEIISRHPDVDLFTVMTNRVKNPEQCADAMFAQYDILTQVGEAILRQNNFFRKVGEERVPIKIDEELKYTKRPISGLVMIFQKRTWQELGGFIDGLMSVDSAFSTKLLDAGGKIAIMQGVYVLHYYRGIEGGAEYTDHLKPPAQIE